MRHERLHQGRRRRRRLRRQGPRRQERHGQGLDGEIESKNRNNEGLGINGAETSVGRLAGEGRDAKSFDDKDFDGENFGGDDAEQNPDLFIYVDAYLDLFMPTSTCAGG